MNYDHTFISSSGTHQDDGMIFINEKAHAICIEGVRFMSDNPTSSIKKVTKNGVYRGFPFASQDMRYRVDAKLKDDHNMTEVSYNIDTGEYEKA